MPTNQLITLFTFYLLCLLVFVHGGTLSWPIFPSSNLFLQHNLSLLAPPKCNINQHIEPQNGLREHDRIESLPGQPVGVDFDQYSGYITVDSVAGRALFYYFVESPRNASKKPLVLWLNGGPGCSSVGDGAFEAIGPFRVNRDGQTLYRNHYAWNQEANIIFLESPAGVGFSYSNTTSDYDKSGDNRTTYDSYIFLRNWLERFPEYKSRDFYITGESYAGHYVPQLAQLILDYNKYCHTQVKINLKATAIGNAYIDSETNTKGQIDFLWTHALISDQVHKALKSLCEPKRVSKVRAKVCRNIPVLAGNINPYNIYAPLCKNSSFELNPEAGKYDPCMDKYVYSYMNMPQVQAALHANVTRLSHPWKACSKKINRNWKDQPPTVLPVIQQLMEHGLHVWLYSGDVDGVVPVTATKYALNKLNLLVKTPWYPWYSNGEVGGYAMGYENMTMVTVRGAGHMVPTYQPGRALSLFTSFLTSKLPPKHNRN